jgi:hypothetical protein
MGALDASRSAADEQPGDDSAGRHGNNGTDEHHVVAVECGQGAQVGDGPVLVVGVEDDDLTG